MQKHLIACLIIFMAIACKDKHTSLSGETRIEIKDFVAAFPKLPLPYRITDTNMAKMADTTTISFAVFSQFIPDSVLINQFGKNANNIKINPVGKIQEENELYLLVNFIQNRNNILQTFLLDKKNVYHSNLQLLKQGTHDGYLHSVSITSEPTFIIGREKLKPNSELLYTRNGYAYDNRSGNFITVMNDSNEDLKRNNEIINPIDTFPKKNKFSGDYAEDKRNYISIRDGNNANKYIFFIHFEKNDGNCTGELKGTMTMRDASHAYYKESGDPCVIDFTLSSKSIIVKEQGNCGNHRGIKCFFDDNYRKKKVSKSPAGK